MPSALSKTKHTCLAMCSLPLWHDKKGCTAPLPIIIQVKNMPFLNCTTSSAGHWFMWYGESAKNPVSQFLAVITRQAASSMGPLSARLYGQGGPHDSPGNNDMRAAAIAVCCWTCHLEILVLWSSLVMDTADAILQLNYCFRPEHELSYNQIERETSWSCFVQNATTSVLWPLGVFL